jgi:transcriptional regulator with XRE-family HTH domain
MDTEIVILSNLSEGQKIKLTRLSRNLRQIDVASLAKVNLADITAIEKDRYLCKSRRQRILQALGLLDDQREAANA